MVAYNFILNFDLNNPELNPEVFIDLLYKAGCDDAIIGVGQLGYISLNFIRESKNELEAISGAILNVKLAIPNANLIGIE